MSGRAVGGSVVSERREPFTTFWARERDRLYRALSLVLGDDVLAGEAVDEAMARAWPRWESIGGYDDPSAWVFRVAQNWSVSARRWRARRPTVASEDLDRVIEDQVADVDLFRAVRSLPEWQRSVIVLRFWLDWPVDQVAAALGLKPATVRSRTHRALDALASMEEVTP